MAFTFILISLIFLVLWLCTQIQAAKGTDKARMYMTKSEINILKIKNIKGKSKRDILLSLNEPEKICI